MFFYTNENNSGNSGYMVNSTLNTISEKLLEQYELRLKEKDEMLMMMKTQILELKTLLEKK
jgi:hypothetical protein